MNNKFITLTDLETSKPVLVNIDQINYLIEDREGKCRIEMSSGHSVLPAESFIEIQGYIRAYG